MTIEKIKTTIKESVEAATQLAATKKLTFNSSTSTYNNLTSRSNTLLEELKKQEASLSDAQKKTLEQLVQTKKDLENASKALFSGFKAIDELIKDDSKPLSQKSIKTFVEKKFSAKDSLFEQSKELIVRIKDLDGMKDAAGMFDGVMACYAMKKGFVKQGEKLSCQGSNDDLKTIFDHINVSNVSISVETIKLSKLFQQISGDARFKSMPIFASLSAKAVELEKKMQKSPIGSFDSANTFDAFGKSLAGAVTMIDGISNDPVLSELIASFSKMVSLSKKIGNEFTSITETSKIEGGKSTTCDSTGGIKKCTMSKEQWSQFNFLKEGLDEFAQLEPHMTRLVEFNGNLAKISQESKAIQTHFTNFVQATGVAKYFIDTANNRLVPYLPVLAGTPSKDELSKAFNEEKQLAMTRKIGEGIFKDKPNPFTDAVKRCALAQKNADKTKIGSALEKLAQNDWIAISLQLGQCQQDKDCIDQVFGTAAMFLSDVFDANWFGGDSGAVEAFQNCIAA